MTPRQRSILAVATLTQAVAMGVTLGVFPLVLEPLEVAFGASRTQVSLGPILIMFALAAAGVFAGGVLDKGRIRRAMLLGTGSLSLALMIAWSAPNLALLGCAALLAGFAIPFIGPLAGMTLVTRSFRENQGRAFGIMSMGPALGMGFFAGVAGFLLQSLEWRSIYLLLAGVTVVLLVPAVWFVIPEQLDAPRTGEGDADALEGAENAEGGVDLGHVVRRPVFWLSALVFALSAGIATGWTNHVAVSDRLPVTGLYVSMLGFEAIAFAAFGSGISTLAVALLGVAFGFVMGGLIPLYMALLGGRLEPQILGRAMGLSNLVMLPIMAMATIGAASIHESRNSYSLAAMIFSVGMLSAIVALLLSNRSAVES
jgi:MFS family permease